MARRATDLAGVKRRVIGVSRFSNRGEEQRLNEQGIETLRCDLLDEASLASLPEIPNVIYLAGLKFGTAGRTADAWAMNTFLPGVVCRKFRASRIVAYSTGAVYGLAPLSGAGCRETDLPEPVGEYAMSCLGRERVMAYFSQTLNIPLALIRLFYACEVRYGVLVDIARKISADEPVELGMGYFNVIWQGDNNAMTLCALEHASSPPCVFNVTGPDRLSIREVAEEMGRMFGKEVKFAGAEQETTCLGDSSKARRLLGEPRVSTSQLMAWAVDWVQRGKDYLGKPTHFEVRDGKY
jgi:nucleoside-diphosphate-sugar epimerase